MRVFFRDVFCTFLPNAVCYLECMNKQTSNIPCETSYGGDACLAESGDTKRSYFWKTTELSVLRMLCECGASRDEVASKLPGRTEAAIYQKTTELGLNCPWIRTDKTKCNYEAIDQAIKARLVAGTGPRAIKELSTEFNKPAWWISRRAGQLGLSSPRLKEPDWTQPEFDILDSCGEEGVNIVRRQLMLSGYLRTVGSINAAMRRREVERLTLSSMSARGVAEMMGVDGNTVLRWIEHRHLRAEPVGNTWRINKRDLRRWLLDHPTLFDLKRVRQEWFMAIMLNDKNNSLIGF